MTPAARVAAAIDILDTMTEGLAAEQALTRWARKSRFAGSKDRAAIRDHVFDVLRIKQTATVLGGGESGRALMIGLMHAQQIDPTAVFTGEGYAPAPLTDVETQILDNAKTRQDVWNLPDWLIPEFERGLGDKAMETAQALQHRAPVTIRVNCNKASREQARDMLLAEGIASEDSSLSPTALSIVDGARRLRGSKCFEQGVVELQDAASQAVVDALPSGRRCLDYCAGGGGKALALAAQPDREVYAHDVDPIRMKDIGPRALRSGNKITQVATAELSNLSPFDLVLCDAPCSGSGAWRRSPDAKWSFSADRLGALCQTQDEILQHAATLVQNGGTLAYATCSVLRAENEDRVEAFLQSNSGWKCDFQRKFDIDSRGDGFFTAHLHSYLP